MPKTKEKPKAKPEAEEQEEETSADADAAAVEEEVVEEQDEVVEEPTKKTVVAPVLTTTPQAQPKITVQFLRSLSKAQWEQVEEQFGMSKEEVINNVQTREMYELAATGRVRDALDDAAESDPKTFKLKRFMREYLDRLPLETRNDPEALKSHMIHAKHYAMGRSGEITRPPAPKAKGDPVRTPTPGEGAGDDDEDPKGGIDEDGAVKPGSEIDLGKFRLKVADLIHPDRRKAIKHPDDPNGVQFKNFDKKPIFRREE